MICSGNLSVDYIIVMTSIFFSVVIKSFTALIRSKTVVLQWNKSYPLLYLLYLYIYYYYSRPDEALQKGKWTRMIQSLKISIH